MADLGRERLLRNAHALLVANSRYCGIGKERHRFTVPSAKNYPFQWFWDSCFHAIAWCYFDAERAAEELRGLFARQRPDGFIPHVLFWDQADTMTRAWHYYESKRWLAVPFRRASFGKPDTTEMMQPPVLAQAVEHVVEAGGGESYAREVLPAVARYYRWLWQARDPDGDGLISIIAPQESGLDFSAAYDAALGLGPDPGPVALELATRGTTVRNKALGYNLRRIFAAPGFQSEDVLVNSLAVQGLESLERLAVCVEDEVTARWAREQARRTLDALIDRCWDAEAGLFRNLDGREQRRNSVATVISLAPLAIGDLPAEIAEALVGHLQRPGGFAARFPVPSVALDERSFRADSRPGGKERIWRGGTWVNTNWMLVHGLRRHGYESLAEHIADATLDLVERYGFREYYNPIAGTPGGAPQFGWSTLAIDM